MKKVIIEKHCNLKDLLINKKILFEIQILWKLFKKYLLDQVLVVGSPPLEAWQFTIQKSETLKIRENLKITC